MSMSIAVIAGELGAAALQSKAPAGGTVLVVGPLSSGTHRYNLLVPLGYSQGPIELQERGDRIRRLFLAVVFVYIKAKAAIAAIDSLRRAKRVRQVRPHPRPLGD